MKWDPSESKIKPGVGAERQSEGSGWDCQAKEPFYLLILWVTCSDAATASESRVALVIPTGSVPYLSYWPVNNQDVTHPSFCFLLPSVKCLLFIMLPNLGWRRWWCKIQGLYESSQCFCICLVVCLSTYPSMYVYVYMFGKGYFVLSFIHEAISIYLFIYFFAVD